MEAPWEGRCGLANGPSKRSLGSSAVRQGRQSARGFQALTRESPCHSRVYCGGQGGPRAVAFDWNLNSKASPAFIPKPWLGRRRSAVHRASIPPVRKPGPPGLAAEPRGRQSLCCFPSGRPVPGLRCVPLVSQSERRTKASSGREAHGRTEVKTVCAGQGEKQWPTDYKNQWGAHSPPESAEIQALTLSPHRKAKQKHLKKKRTRTSKIWWRQDPVTPQKLRICSALLWAPLTSKGGREGPGEKTNGNGQ